jgi:hypothetical protein
LPGPAGGPIFVVPYDAGEKTGLSVIRCSIWEYDFVGASLRCRWRVSDRNPT